MVACPVAADGAVGHVRANRCAVAAVVTVGSSTRCVALLSDNSFTRNGEE